VLDGRKLAVQRPRVRGIDGHELHLESYAAFHAVDLLTDAGSGQHCDHDLRDHRKVAADDVALADAAVLEGVGEPLNVTQQIGVVTSRVTPSSPCQWKAIPSQRPASTCRSRQLLEALIRPSVNHV